MRSILLHVNDDDCMEARLQIALDIAREFNAHVTCLQPVSYDFAVPGDLYGTMIAELLPVIQQNADKLRERVSSRLANEDAAWNWRQEEGSPRALLARTEGLADLIVLGARDPVSDGKGPSGLAGYMATHGRSPVLVVPEHARSLNLGGLAVVGWNGSLESAHALRAAVPLLQRAGAVNLVNVAEALEQPGAFLPLLDAGEYLSRHGIRCEISEAPRGDQSISRALADTAVERGASFLVIGAYGHTRAIETLFGGVTRELFTDPPVPVFTAH
jgi:nucleotide-binding universal stress UspA family protein